MAATRSHKKLQVWCNLLQCTVSKMLWGWLPAFSIQTSLCLYLKTQQSIEIRLYYLLWQHGSNSSTENLSWETVMNTLNTQICFLKKIGSHLRVVLLLSWHHANDEVTSLLIKTCCRWLRYESLDSCKMFTIRKDIIVKMWTSFQYPDIWP